MLFGRILSAVCRLALMSRINSRTKCFITIKSHFFSDFPHSIYKLNSTNFTKYFSLASLVIFPAFILVNQYLSGLTFILAMLLGCRYLFSRQNNAFTCARDEKIFFISLSLLTVTAVISGIANEFDFARLDRLSLPMLAIPVYYFYRNNPVNEGAFWIGLVCGAFGAGTVALYQVIATNSVDRADGITNAIMFGDIALAMGFMSMAGSGWFIRQHRWQIIFPILGMTFGLLASALSLARGGWLALPIVFGLFLWISAKHLSIARLLTIFAIALIGLSVIYHTPQFKVKNRVNLTITNFNSYVESDNPDDPARNTGLGTRLDMWKSSWYIFQENPLLGVGWGSYRSYTEKYVSQRLVSENAGNFPHPHNQFFSALAKGGLLGLLAVLVTFTIPLVMFHAVLVSDQEPAESKRLALAGLIFLLSFMAFGLTEAVFERSRIMTFFAFYLVVLMALMHSSKTSNQ